VKAYSTQPGNHEKMAYRYIDAEDDNRGQSGKGNRLRVNTHLSIGYEGGGGRTSQTVLIKSNHFAEQRRRRGEVSSQIKPRRKYHSLSMKVGHGPRTLFFSVGRDKF